MLSDRQKERLLSAVELIDPKNKGKMYNLIKGEWESQMGYNVPVPSGLSILAPECLSRN